MLANIPKQLFDQNIKIIITHVATGATVEFQPLVKDVSIGNVSATWSDNNYYGRNGIIPHYTKSTESLKINFTVIGVNQVEVQENYDKIMMLKSFSFGVYRDYNNNKTNDNDTDLTKEQRNNEFKTAYVLVAPPLLRIKFVNIVEEFPNTEGGIYTFMKSFNANINKTDFERTDKDKNIIIPVKYEIDLGELPILLRDPRSRGVVQGDDNKDIYLDIKKKYFKKDGEIYEKYKKQFERLAQPISNTKEDITKKQKKRNLTDKGNIKTDNIDKILLN